MTKEQGEARAGAAPRKTWKLGVWPSVGLALCWVAACIGVTVWLPRNDAVIAIGFILMFVPLYLTIALGGSADHLAVGGKTLRRRNDAKSEAIGGAVAFGSGFTIFGTFVVAAGGPGGAAMVVVGLTFISVAIARKRSSFEDEPRKPRQRGRV